MQQAIVGQPIVGSIVVDYLAGTEQGRLGIGWETLARLPCNSESCCHYWTSLACFDIVGSIQGHVVDAAR
jgi:hypothetical protein